MEVPTVYYDSDCGLCSTSVRLLEARLSSPMNFVPLQSAEASEALREHRLDPEATDTVVLIEDGRAFARSEAALRVARRLRWPWRAASALAGVPRPIRDAVYDFVARHRHRGGARTCGPAPDQRVRSESTRGDGAGEEVAPRLLPLTEPRTSSSAADGAGDVPVHELA